MTIVLIIVILLLIFGGGYYGRGRWYGNGFNPMGVIWLILIVILIVWLVNQLGVIRFR
jgi:hypothetical protein